MSVLTTSQLTFCDLKDSYSIYVDTEYIGVACDNAGLVTEDKTVTINYRVFAGSTMVGASCTVSNLPSGVTLVSNVSSSDIKDGSITLKITQGETLNNESTSSMKIIFTTIDDDKFTFEKYITFIKSIKGYDGADAVNFQIYSVNGFEFSNALTSITLKTVAIKAGDVITSGLSYQWMWWNGELNQYEDISGQTSSSLIVNMTDVYAFSSLKCKMIYDGILYEDYVSLTHSKAIYTAIAKFFDNNNIVSTDEDYLIVYVELYKDNNPEELLYTDNVYVGTNSVSTSGLITTNLTGSYTNNDMKYFVCEKINNGITEYDTILGKYDSSSERWYEVKNNYIYKNDLFINASSPVVFVPKNKISRSLNINFEIYDEENIAISRTSAMLLDLNDPTISSYMPENPKEGQLWLDTSITPSVLKMWDGENWVSSGAVVYTSMPNKYCKGDLWILSKEDTKLFPDIGEGTMLKANTTSDTFNINHWEDVDKEATEQKQNIKQYFLFNKDTGLRIGQLDNKFYVNISSTEIGFYDATGDMAQKVVSISNQSANIRDTTLEGNTKIKNDATINGNTNFYGQMNICDPNANSEDSISDVLFVWKIEPNGSISLAVAT